METLPIPTGNEHALLWWFIGGLITAVTALAGAIVKLWADLQKARASQMEADNRCQKKLIDLDKEWQAKYRTLEEQLWLDRSSAELYRSRSEAEILRLASLAESLGSGDDVDAVIFCDASTGRITEWNLGACLLLGWTGEEMEGQSIKRCIPDHWLASHEEKWNDCIQKRDSVPRRGPFEVHALTKWGQEIPVLIVYACFDDEMGKRQFKAVIRRRIEQPQVTKRPRKGRADKSGEET
jgi:PAS domain S-box-containing protein